MEIFTIASWQIWKQRNDTIFDRGRPSFNCRKVLFLEEAKLQAQRFLDEAKRAAFLLCVELLVFFLFCFSFGLFRPAPAVWHLARQVCTVFLPLFNKISTVGASPSVFNVKKRITIHIFSKNAGDLFVVILRTHLHQTHNTHSTQRTHTAIAA